MIIIIIIINPLITHFYFWICCTLCWHLGDILATFWVCKEIRICITIGVTVDFNNFHKIVINFTWLFLWPCWVGPWWVGLWFVGAWWVGSCWLGPCWTMACCRGLFTILSISSLVDSTYIMSLSFSSSSES